MKLVEVTNSNIGKRWSQQPGPPELSFGPTGDCPKCLERGINGGGNLVYGLESKVHVCICCWSVFQEAPEVAE